MARLDLSIKEQLAMLYVLVKQVSQEDLSGLVPKYGRSSPSFAAFADLVSTRWSPVLTYFYASCSSGCTLAWQAGDSLSSYLDCLTLVVFSSCPHVLSPLGVQCGLFKCFPVSRLHHGTVCSGMLLSWCSTFQSGSCLFSLSDHLTCKVVPQTLT